MKILIFGKGFIGTRFAHEWPDAILSSVRIDDAAAVAKALDEHRPDAVVNAAGKTGRPNVDWCETHQTETCASNVIGPLVLASACQARGVYLLHLSSGCIFYGPSPSPSGWREDDFANPVSYYSRTKYAADLLLSRLPNVGIVRLRMPIDRIPNERNLIDKLSGYKQVIDVENSVTVIDDLVGVCRALVAARGQGIFHAVNPGTLKHRELLELYRMYADHNHTCEWIAENELEARGLVKAKRSNCILASSRLKELGIEMRPIEIAIIDTMMKYASAKNAVASPPRISAAAKRIKGVICAGGLGTRLAPLTNITNKHLLPVYNKPMILYPLYTLINAGVHEIMVVTGPEFAHQFVKLLGSGAQYGVNITYRIQDKPGGIAHALGLAKDFVGSDNCAVILGDNVFDGDFSSAFAAFASGATVFYKETNNARAYGVLEIDATGKVLSIEEKPLVPKSNLAQVGLYLFDHRVFEVIDGLHPSGRGELEITDVTDAFRRAGELVARPVSGPWWDVGSFEGLAAAAEYFSKNNNGRS
jgi:glucose-1-phosphate thymidylyltransferase